MFYIKYLDRIIRLLFIITFCCINLWSVSINYVYPKIITPGTSSNENDIFFIKYSNPENEELRLRIFDIYGCLVKEIDTNNPSASSDGFWLLKWDGTDKYNNYVNPGIYIYQLETVKKTINGIVCVVR